jgi:competence protein ComEC
MRLPILCFAFGVWLCQQQADVPGWPELGALAGVVTALLLAAFVWRRRTAAVLPVALFLAGFLWAAAMAQWRLADQLPFENEGRDVRVTGVIAGMPQAYENGQRFDFEVEDADARVPSRLSLAWYRGLRDDEWHRFQEVHAGERWQLTVRLKRPHGNLNPHGFDYEAWLFERNLRATGYVRTTREAQPNRRLEEFVARPLLAVERARERIRARLLAALPEGGYAGVLVALAVGDQRAIDASQWQLFNRTGTTHLMSISGLHVTMVAGLFYGLVSFLWRRSPYLALRLPAQKAAAAGGWVAAFAYCLLAGFGVPAQRTLYMLTVVAAVLWLDRTSASSRVLSLALAIVLLLDPWAVLSAGFWLSFGAVAVLFYIGSGRLGRKHWWSEWGRAQWAVSLAMIPALLALFQQFSLVSPLANAVAIPVVSLVVTPLALLAIVMPLDPLLWLGHAILAGLMTVIEWLATLPLAVWQQHAPSAWALLLALSGCGALLLPRGFPGRWVGGVLFLPLVMVPPDRPGEGEARLTVLDVGQGLAVHVQTRSRDLIYDTGPQYSLEADSGNRIIVPYLRALGVRRLDGLIITHLDKDHSGGAASIIETLPVDWVASSLPAEHELRRAAANHVACFAGQRWEWDGVRFDVLHPAREDHAGPARKSNDMSCVLKIVTAAGSVLLTSDIEMPSEWRLLGADRAALRADHLLVPHHGSRTSSTPEFIAAVGARTAIFPVGYRSRFRHPHPEVLARYEARGARVLRTDRDGAMTLRLGPAGPQIELERERRRRYWHGS